MRKVLSFVLVLTLVLSSFSMAFAATPAAAAGLTDVAGNANEDAIQVAYDLGIVTGNPDGTFKPGEAVNRAQFAAMLTRALDIPDSALAGYTATTFKDTAGYGWAVPYLAFCQSKGILLGDGAGNVMPGNTITVNEAMTMALRAIGYTANSSLLVGAWPANYVSIAQNNDLYTDIAKSTTVDKASAAQIIYNLLTVQKVSVNSDGSTDSLTTKVDGDDVDANLLNTNLGCRSDENVVLGDEYSYDDAIINITNDIGAYGTAYLNSDDELVAFTKDSTALTGKVNSDGDFEVGDVTYSFGANTVTAAAFTNTTIVDEYPALTTNDAIDFAADNSNDGDTVTLNVDLSGKKIKDIYSIVGWSVDYNNSDAALAASDVQDDIADKVLLDGNFVENDNKDINMNSFALVGVDSLDKIAENNALYVYTDENGDIRKVEVGTKTVEGAVDEINTDDSTLTIGGTEYDVASLPTAKAAVTVDDFSTDSEGTFYLDVNGDVYDFDGTTAVSTYGIVKAASAETDFDNFKVKLYMSDDATKTLYLSESDPADIDWTSTGATTIDAITTAALIGYSLDSNGDIDAIDNTAVAAAAASMTFKSTKVLKTAEGSFSIDKNAVVFTYTADMTATGDYDVCTLADVNIGAITGAGAYILNDSGDVAALFIEAANADTNKDAIYGVFNKRTTTKDSSGDPIYKFTGLIDGTAFTYTTSDDTNAGDGAYDTYSGAGTVGLYSITLNGSDAIAKIEVLPDYVDGTTGIVTTGAIAADGLASDNTVVTVGGEDFPIADDAVVYKYDADNDVYTVSKLSLLDETDTIWLYDTKGDDADGIADVVIYQEN